MGKRLTKAQRAEAERKQAIQDRAVAIMDEAGIGYVRALIRARAEFGLVSPNKGKVRTPAAEAASA